MHSVPFVLAVAALICGAVAPAVRATTHLLSIAVVLLAIALLLGAVR